MENKWALVVGIVLAIGVAYAVYRLFVKPPPLGTNETHIDKVDYEILYNWLKHEYAKLGTVIQNGYKFGILPSAIAEQTYSEEYNRKISLDNGQNVICVFIIDDKEENVIANHYFVYKEMGQALKDMLHSNKVYIQELKK